MFKLVSKYKPSGDQPEAIKELVDGINNGEKHQVYLHEARGKRPRYQGPPDEGQGHGAQGRARIRRLKPERRPLSQRGTA